MTPAAARPPGQDTPSTGRSVGSMVTDNSGPRCVDAVAGHRRGRREVVAQLRRVADVIEIMPQRRAAEVLLRIGDALAQLDREVGRDA